MNYSMPHLGNVLHGTESIRVCSAVLRAHKIFRYSSSASYCGKAERALESTLGLGVRARLLCNCTVALRAALIACRIRVGQVVLLPGLSFIATPNAALSVGLIPKFVDVDERGAMSPTRLLECLQALPSAPAAVIFVHMDGAPGRVAECSEIARRFGVPLIEDCAQAFGAVYKGSPVGTFGQFGCFSFQARKLLSTGEGGALCSVSPAAFKRACAYSDHGAERSDRGTPIWSGHSCFGENYKATELQGALTLAQLKQVSRLRRLLDTRYRKLLALIPGEIVEPRPEGSVPVSVWLRGDAVPKTIKKLCYQWTGWNLPRHPAIAKRRSPYMCGFPWNLEKSCVQSKLPISERIAKYRVSLPVPVDAARFMRTMAAVRKVYA